MKAGVVIPCYNEHESIQSLIREILVVNPEGDIVVVDDSSDSRTELAVKEVLSSQVHLIRRTKKGGRGSAVLEGLRFLNERNCAICVEMDADFSHPPQQIPELIKVLQDRKLEMLIASRYLETSEIHNWPFKRKLFSFLSNKLARLVLGVPIKDYTNGFRCYSCGAMDEILKTCGRLGTGFIALSEITVNLYYRNYEIGEIPTIFVNRVRGESALDFREIKNAVKGLFLIHGLKRQLLESRSESERMAKIAR